MTGELYCSGVGLARGYWRDEEQTAAAFIIHPRTGERLYRTGDRGRFLPDGTLEFLGRNDSQIQVRGHRIEPGEVEAALLTHPGVRAAVVTGRPDPAGPGHRGLIAYVQSIASAEELRAHLRTLLPEHLVPATVVALDSFPLNANGKVDRQALAARPVALHEADGTAGTRTALEQMLIGIWAEVCELAEIGPADNFFELGGDSVLATRIVTRLREILDDDAVSVRTLFLEPTVAGFAAALVAAEEHPGRLEATAAIHLEVEQLSADQVEAELSARRGGDV